MAGSRKKKKPELVAQHASDAPLDSAALLKYAQPVLTMLTADLLERADASTAITRALKASHSEELTTATYAVWRREIMVQIAASWLLSCVFVRTLEDRGLLDSKRIAGEGALGAQHSFFQIAPYLTERDYLLTIFRELEHSPAAGALFDREHNLAWRLAPSAAAAKQLLEMFRMPTADAPAFRFGQADTRFLGDLYQDLSKEVRKRYALLQTPDFIEAFILDHTLDPAIEEFGLEEADLIDPTCGSGHFLLGAFDRLYEGWLGRGASTEQAVEKALGAVYGADLNPYAVSIARFRLTLSALEKLRATSLRAAPKLTCRLAVADSLLHNYNVGQKNFAEVAGQDAVVWRGNLFDLSDPDAARRMLERTFAAVVGNPPYIKVTDADQRAAYRRIYTAAYRDYSLSVPFMQRFFQLGRKGAFVGQITSNSFMKREFGKKLIEEYLPSQDLTLIVNTAEAYIPGHGTPTVLIFGRTQPPERPKLQAVLAGRGEPSIPDDPAKGKVWTSIADHWNDTGFENEYITVEKVEREKLDKHPWSLGGGGAAELKALIESRSTTSLGEVADAVGFGVISGEDNVFMIPRIAGHRMRIPDHHMRRYVLGEEVRDWVIGKGNVVVWTCTPTGDRLPETAVDPGVMHFLWPYRTNLRARKAFGVPVEQKGIPWWALREVYGQRLQTPLTIAFAEVATHCHFALDRGGRVFKQTAPIIKLPDTATEDDHLALLAYLNSSVACFWLKQVCMNKGGSGIGRGIQDEAWESRYQFDATKSARLPLPPGLDKLTALARVAVQLSVSQGSPLESLMKFGGQDVSPVEIDTTLGDAERQHRDTRDRLVAVNEKIDQQTYQLFGLVESAAQIEDSVRPGNRNFERRLVSAETPTAWFSRNGYETPEGGELPPLIGPVILEKPTYKRRWGVHDWSAWAHQVCGELLQDRLEKSLADSPAPLCLTRQTLERSLLAAEPALSRWWVAKTSRQLGALLHDGAVPELAVARFTQVGLDKHNAWEQTWDLQRQEDRGESVGQIPVPPSYRKGDFRDAIYWTLRGKLDVPKERFISYPGCESDKDSEPIYGWAGWDHAQRAEALAALYVDRKENEGWSKERLQPMLAGLLELLPWVKQWHPEPDADTGEPFGDFLEQWLEGECRLHGFTHDDLRAWRPTTKRGRKKKATKKKTTKKKAAKAKAAKAKKDPS